MTGSDSTRAHRSAAAPQKARCGVLTVSDTRTRETDAGGKTLVELLEQAGHTVERYDIVRDEPVDIDKMIRTWLDARPAPDVVITTGGTGIASRDTTVEVVQRIALDLAGKEIEGFGELFRMLSFQEVGPAAMLSRALAVLIGQTLLFTLPGSTSAVRLAMEKLILPELPHMVWERKR
ncbi:MAG: molybdenum cofactor biosynthesis protein [Phycisphaera sp.]|nr:molybdenum cofactor biosynthesis protein [Phycisphaera sp.]